MEAAPTRRPSAGPLSGGHNFEVMHYFTINEIDYAIDINILVNSLWKVPSCYTALT